MLKLFFATVCCAALTICAAEAQAEKSGNTPANPPTAPASTNDVAVIKTSEGEMVIEFWVDVAPNTVENFKKLAKKGFYDGTAFHRIIKGFMIQAGDPYTKDPAAADKYGSGGPGYTIKAEFNKRHHGRGVLSMARRGDDIHSAGSQFFICLGDANSLDGQYTGFGQLIKGDDVLGKIGDAPTKLNRFGTEKSVPVNRVSIESIKIVPASTLK